MLIATLAGVIVTVVLRFLRWFMGYKRFSFSRRQWEFYVKYRHLGLTLGGAWWL